MGRFSKMQSATSPLLLPLLLLSTAVFAAVGVSETEPTRIDLKPDVAPDSLDINYIQKVGSCAYEVTIATSCVSPLFTTDEIGILFGDNHGNQIVEKNLDNGNEAAFDVCKKDTFNLKHRPCCDQISYLYLYKSGADNWLPLSVKISAADIKPILFLFNSSIPRNTWFGFDLRQFPFTPPSAPPPSDFPFPLPASPPPHHSPPEPIFPPPPPPPIPPSDSGRVSGQKWAAFAILLAVAVL